MDCRPGPARASRCLRTPGRLTCSFHDAQGSQRVRASLPLLETSQASVEEVSAAVGFESPVTYRHHFTKIMRTSPSAYRRGFRTVQVGREATGPDALRTVAP
ncbi:helix-turn-helix domain-containing protein [Streptomyces sp. MNU76]|uniref:helix-turn-helix domain-containing protein n=1 Tax=Streptomyces sp. MNU76 TaxID=2560026 RepID=UPI001E509E88|nr:helix-turn-helix domain-containing protein [Streptomyces sp. MNU76]MCC9707500.1 helix-turn-helix domain-containing protein [Streptomyces sp. MNU76]